MWWMNQRVELATALYARSNTAGGMSSIRTAEPDGCCPSPPGKPVSRWPPGTACAAARSASDSAAHTHSTSAWPATAPGRQPPVAAAGERDGAAVGGDQDPAQPFGSHDRG